ncbi:MAG TPA: hypothetical protein V6D17_15975 [Candidatus Obscuribacterales bacterium]
MNSRVHSKMCERAIISLLLFLLAVSAASAQNPSQQRSQAQSSEIVQIAPWLRPGSVLAFQQGGGFTCTMLSGSRQNGEAFAKRLISAVNDLRIKHPTTLMLAPEDASLINHYFPTVLEPRVPKLPVRTINTVI